MSGLGRRLERVAETLTAKERALLWLRALKEEQPVDLTWRRTMPQDQAEEFDRHVNKIRGVNVTLGWYMLVLHQEVEKLGLQLESVKTLMSWGLSAWGTRFFMMRQTTEPLTESEYQELEAQARATFVPVADLAEHLVEEDQPRQEKARELAALVEQGALVGRREGDALLVEAGSFFDWLGEAVAPQPVWAREYEVCPDEGAEQVRQRRDERLAVRDGVEEAPLEQTARLLGWEDELVELAEPSPRDDQLERHVKLVRASFPECWRRLGAVEEVVEEARRDLDREDPLLPDQRAMLEQTRRKLEWCRQAEEFIGPLTLEAPSEADLAWVHGLIE